MKKIVLLMAFFVIFCQVLKAQNDTIFHISQIIEDCNQVKIDIEQDGRVTVMHEEFEWIDKAIEKILNIVREVEVGKIYQATVSRIEKFGCFCTLWEGQEGLCR